MDNRSFLRDHSEELNSALKAIDFCIILITLGISLALRGISPNASLLLTGALAAALFLFIASNRRLYTSWRMGTIYQEISEIWIAWSLTFTLLITLAFLFKVTADYSRIATTLWFFLAPIALSLLRIAVRSGLRQLRGYRRDLKRAVIVGAGPLGCRLADVLGSDHGSGIEIQALYDDKKPMGNQLITPEGRALTVAGDLAQMVKDVTAQRIEIVYFALPMQEERRILESIEHLHDTPASIYVVPDLFIAELAEARWGRIGELPMVALFEEPFGGISGGVKRLEDLLLATLALTLLLLPMLVIALLVKLTSDGPVLFRQRRYGLMGEEIQVWKFRTMTVCEDGPEIPQAQANDARVTPLGHFLRRTSLDELPQFVNVLQGRMSIVGPRPHAVAHNELYRKLIRGYMRRHKVRPGITGWAQVNGARGETKEVAAMEQRVRYDLEYIQNWSLWFDLRIILRTVWVVLKGDRAY